jgi:hypothetical protein
VDGQLRSAGDDKPLELRLGQAIAWCTPRVETGDPARSLRSDELRPWVLESDRESAVRRVLESRASAVYPHVCAAAPVRTRNDLEHGRLLLYVPDENLTDGAAELETEGFFDIDNAPPWDTWVGLFRDGSADRFLAEYLVCWVPAGLVALVQRGIDVNPEECIVWLADARVPLADALRSRDLLG